MSQKDGVIRQALRLGLCTFLLLISFLVSGGLLWLSKAPAPLLTAVQASYLTVFFYLCRRNCKRQCDKVVRIGGRESSQRTACYCK